nr:hypothetical protein [Tanacetum cinerariifolium]
MTGNISYLTDFKEFDGGYVTFGRGAKGGKITGKGIIRTVPRKNNMYSADLKNIVPKKDLTCLVAKATNDESMLWHRRLGHKNFKNINKLVKENLVREKGSKREYSVARTPQQNRVAERRNKTLIEANRVLVVKPHFKTPYELFRDHLGKFDEKSNEGFFVGYFINSKAFRVYNTRTRKVEENLYIKFLENKPIIAGDGPKRLFDIDALTESMNYVLVIADSDNKDNDGPCKESESDNQEKPNAENSTKDVNTVGPSINTSSLNTNTASPTVNTVRQSDDFFGADNDMRSLDGVLIPT